MTLLYWYFLLFLVSFVVKSDMCAVSTPDKPALSEEEVERKSKSIIDEFLHINDFKVNVDSDEGK